MEQEWNAPWMFSHSNVLEVLLEDLYQLLRELHTLRPTTKIDISENISNREIRQG